MQSFEMLTSYKMVPWSQYYPLITVVSLSKKLYPYCLVLVE